MDSVSLDLIGVMQSGTSSISVEKISSDQIMQPEIIMVMTCITDGEPTESHFHLSIGAARTLSEILNEATQ